ncbi:MAG: IS5/IS1182 family transposase, partial [Pseudomonadota bacterium]
WLGRLAEDWEKSTASAEAWINVSHIRLTIWRLAKQSYV